MKKLQLFKTMLLLVTMLAGNVNSVFADTEITIWAEDFTGAEPENPKSSTAYDAPDACTNDDYSATYTYSSKKNLYYETSATGTAPELLVPKNGGTFTVTITDMKGVTGDLTLTWVQNKNPLSVTANVNNSTKTALTIDGSVNSSNNSQSVTIKNATSEGVILVFTATNAKKNVRVDNFVLKGTKSTPVYTITAESNNTEYGTVSLNGSVITGSPKSGYRYASPAYTVNPANSATVSQDGNAFTVTPSANTTVTINFEAIPTHSVTFSNPVEGTVTVKNGDDAITSGDEIREGTELTLIATPGAGKKFTSWTVTGATPVDENAATTTLTVGANNISISANLDDVTTYAINWNVNGVNVRTDNVEENTAITFPKAISGVPAGYELLGWVAEANKIDTPTDTDPSANYITSATSTADITYYAVMAVGVTGTETATLELTSTDGYSNSYDSQSFTDNKGNTWSGSVAVSTQDGKPCIQMKTSSGGSAITAPTFPGIITEIKMLARNGSSKTARSFNFNSVSNSNTGDLGTLSVAANHKYDSELTATLKSEFNSFYLWVTDNLGFNKISVTYNATTYSNYCTTVPTATVNINALCNDGEATPTYYSTYSNDKAFVVPADMTVSAIKVADGKLVVTSYDEGDIVKAGTGVMVSSATSGNHTITLAAGGDEIEDNCLYASGDAGIDAAGMAAIVDDCKYYRLTMHGYEAGVNPGDLGFFWGAASGAAFALAANKAFLAVPTALAKEGFSISFDGENIDDPSSETTAIAGVETMKEVGTTYNLAGQKVNASYKGIVIVNGKKFINK